VGLLPRWSDHSLAGGGLAVSWLDGTPSIGSGNPHDWKRPTKESDLPDQSQESAFHSFRSQVDGPTDSYIPRPRDPYDTPRRKRSTRSQSDPPNLHRVPSNRVPVPPLPALPAFHPVGLETDSTAGMRIDRRQGSRSRSTRKESGQDLPDLPPPTRRPQEDLQEREIQSEGRISPTDMYAQLGG
jgi:hypothetical protein